MQAVRLPTMASAATPMATVRGRSACVHLVLCGSRFMALWLLEALLALVILIAIVWWTMFAGRSKGELRSTERHDEPRN